MRPLTTLINRSAKGHEEAQRELYVNYRVKWYMVSKRYARNNAEADDIFQEGLIQIYKDLHQFDSTRSSFDTWSSRVISHAALRYLRKHNWHNSMDDLEAAYDNVSEDETILEQLAAKELIGLLQSLPTGYRLVFNLFVLEGFSHKEIADKLNINEGTSRSQLAKAKRVLRKKLEYQLSQYS